MDVEFRTRQLAQIETGKAGKLRLPIAVIKAAQHKLRFIRDAPDETTLRNWKSLHYEKLKGSRKNQRSIKLNDQYRMILEIDTNAKPHKVHVLDIVDYH